MHAYRGAPPAVRVDPAGSGSRIFSDHMIARMKMHTQCAHARALSADAALRCARAQFYDIDARGA